jgi:tRNA(fMet)-specific endonuclease VapC
VGDKPKPLYAIWHCVSRNKETPRLVSAVTYAEMRFSVTGPKVSPRHIQLVDAFSARLNAIQPWNRVAVDATMSTRVSLCLAATPPLSFRIARHATLTQSVSRSSTEP